MSNILPFVHPATRPEMAMGADALIHGVALHRRHPDDLRWIKENAELLRMIVSTRLAVDRDVLERAYRPVLDDLGRRIGFFPQYFRFFLHFALDLQTLGMSGPDVGDLARIALRSGLPMTELSDLNRLESRWLFGRADVAMGAEFAGVEDRLRAAFGLSRAYALPNRRAAYELTHVALYLTDFGRTPSAGPEGIDTALRYVGIVAWLEQNLDLLAEVVLALDCLGAHCPEDWRLRISAALPAFRFRPFEPGEPADGYHSFLMCAWSQLARAPHALSRPFPAQGFSIVPPSVETGALRALSIALMSMAPAQRRGWNEAYESVLAMLDAEHQAIVEGVATAVPEFGDFFEAFSRSDLQDCVA